MFDINKLNKELSIEFKNAVTAKTNGNCIFLDGALENWNDIVKAGYMAVDKKSHTVVNNIKFIGHKESIIVPPINDNFLNEMKTDVLIIGAGIIGCSVARELSRFKLNVLLVDKEHDVALHASSRNDGMIHPGIELKKGQVKFKFNRRGNKMYDKICNELDVEFKRTGQFVCVHNSKLNPLAYAYTQMFKRKGLEANFVSAKKLKEVEPNLSNDISCAIHFPSAGIVCPYNLTIAYAENAVQNGVKLVLDTAVLSMEIEESKIVSVKTNRGTVYPKLVINAAGVFSESIAKMAQDHFFSIHPRKGTNSIIDKKSAWQVKTIAASIGIKTKNHSKGGGLVSTIDGNLLVGPNAIEIFEKEDFSTDNTGIRNIFEKQGFTSPHLSTANIITYFTGIRAATYEEDFIIQQGNKNIIHVAGIQSPGLTAAPAIAVYVAKLTAQILKETMPIKLNKKFNPNRKAIPKVSKMQQEERNQLIKQNSDYGVIICRCEEVSRGEIIDALRRPVKCQTIDGVKRRVRPGMGRCQGGFCSPLVAQIIADEFNIKLEEVLKSGYGSNILLGSTKGKAIENE